MKYTTTEHFSRNLYRHIRFSYPTFMFGEPTFEIDDDGTPFWVCPRVVKKIGLFGGEDIRGAVLVNAVSGESEYYATVPEWVDRVYSADLIIQQYDYHGMYVHGWFNSVLGQKDVTISTAGYNYIAMNDDVYMYTGITSVGSDQSNIGFILSNQRTKETKFYKIAGATEHSAMASAEGVVQHLGYTATFPLLLNTGGEPTYFLSLKDNAGLVKMYAMVNVQQYQIVATGASVAECEQNYIKLLKQNGVSAQQPADGEDTEALGVVEDIRSSVVEGNTIYYFKLADGDAYYSVYASDSPEAALVSVGDTVKLELAYGSSGSIRETTSLTLVSSSAGEAEEGGEAASLSVTTTVTGGDAESFLDTLKVAASGSYSTEEHAGFSLAFTVTAMDADSVSIKTEGTYGLADGTGGYSDPTDLFTVTRGGSIEIGGLDGLPAPVYTIELA